MVDRMDQNISRLVKKLEETDKLKNTRFFRWIMEQVMRDRKSLKNRKRVGTVGSFEAIGSWAMWSTVRLRNGRCRNGGRNIY